MTWNDLKIPKFCGKLKKLAVIYHQPHSFFECMQRVPVGTSGFPLVPVGISGYQWVPVGTRYQCIRCNNKTKTKSAVLPTSLMSFLIIIRSRWKSPKLVVAFFLLVLLVLRLRTCEFLFSWRLDYKRMSCTYMHSIDVFDHLPQQVKISHIGGCIFS